MQKLDLSVVHTRGSIQVSRRYMIVLTTLLGQLLIRVPGCWKAASISRQCPVQNRLLAEVRMSGIDHRFDGCLFVWVLWHINICRLFNAKSIFMKIVLFQTIQFSISTQFKCEYSLIMKNNLISIYLV